MPKIKPAMQASEVARLTEPGTYAVGEVAGLLLYVDKNRARRWKLRILIGGKRTDIGLGGYPTFGLADARKAARQIRTEIQAGRNPVAERRELRAAMRAALAVPTFDQCAASLLAAKAPGFRNVKHAAQWASTLRTYASPHFGNLRVNLIEKRHVLAALEPIWTSKTETASRLRGRIEAVLDWAITAEHREGPNPARWHGHLENLLPEPGKVAKRKHHAALPYAATAAFMAELRVQQGFAARALEFTVYTAARSGEVRGARWSEFDLEAGLWIIPAERMKAKREHRVPLSAPAVALLKSLPKLGDYVFTAPAGGMYSDMALSAVLRRMNVDCTVHGFRSTFRDWAAEQTSYPREIIEMALAHMLKDKTEAAYFRSDVLEKRRRLMGEWSAYLNRPAVSPASVTAIGEKKSGASR